MSAESCCLAVGKLLPRFMPGRSASETTSVGLTHLELEEVQKIQSALPEFAFIHLPLLLQAFTHRSYTRSNRSSVDNNERLEFLGDAVLSFIIAEHVVDTYYIAEGGMTSIRQLLSSNEALATVGRNLGLSQCIRRSIGDQGNGDPSDIQVAGAVEALIGALYVDGGIEAARAFVESHILPLLPDLIEPIEDHPEDLHPKTALQRVAQTRLGIVPKYLTESWGGAYPNSPQTTVVVMLGARELARATGANKKIASRLAAEEGLRVLKNER